MATTNYENMNTGMQAYHQESARRCPMNESCNCCILICWLVLGLIAGIIDITRVDSGTYYADCPDNLTDVDGECCAWEVQDKVVAIPGTCSDYDTAVTVQGVTQIVSAAAGAVGIIGLSCYISYLLLVPAAYSAVQIILIIVSMVMLGSYTMSYILAPIIQCGIAFAIMVLFIGNFRLIKDTDPKGGSV